MALPKPTPLSAAWTLVAWAQAHGRDPRYGDALSSADLWCPTTYYRTFPEASSFSAIVAQAFLIVSGLWQPPVLLEPADRTRKPCLGCRKSIVDEGAHIRFCTTCRYRQNAEETDYDETWTMPSTPLLRRWSTAQSRGWEEDIAW